MVRGSIRILCDRLIQLKNNIFNIYLSIISIGKMSWDKGLSKINGFSVYKTIVFKVKRSCSRKLERDLFYRPPQRKKGGLYGTGKTKGKEIN